MVDRTEAKLEDLGRDEAGAPLLVVMGPEPLAYLAYYGPEAPPRYGEVRIRTRTAETDALSSTPVPKAACRRLAITACRSRSASPVDDDAALTVPESLHEGVFE